LFLHFLFVDILCLSVLPGHRVFWKTSSSSRYHMLIPVGPFFGCSFALCGSISKSTTWFGCKSASPGYLDFIHNIFEMIRWMLLGCFLVFEFLNLFYWHRFSSYSRELCTSLFVRVLTALIIFILAERKRKEKEEEYICVAILLLNVDVLPFCISGVC
jgi:hypothetical protein